MAVILDFTADDGQDGLALHLTSVKGRVLAPRSERPHINGPLEQGINDRNVRGRTNGQRPSIHTQHPCRSCRHDINDFRQRKFAGLIQLRQDHSQ